MTTATKNRRKLKLSTKENIKVVYSFKYDIARCVRIQEVSRVVKTQASGAGLGIKAD